MAGRWCVTGMPGSSLGAGSRARLPNGSQNGPRNHSGTRPTKRIRPLTWYFTVGVAGFEPTTSSSRTKRAAKLRYTPIVAARRGDVVYFSPLVAGDEIRFSCGVAGVRARVAEVAAAGGFRSRRRLQARPTTPGWPATPGLIDHPRPTRLLPP